jgi:hypothetical protein
MKATKKGAFAMASQRDMRFGKSSWQTAMISAASKSTGHADKTLSTIASFSFPPLGEALKVERR